MSLYGRCFTHSTHSGSAKLVHIKQMLSFDPCWVVYCFKWNQKGRIQDVACDTHSARLPRIETIIKKKKNHENILLFLSPKEGMTVRRRSSVPRPIEKVHPLNLRNTFLKSQIRPWVKHWKYVFKLPKLSGINSFSWITLVWVYSSWVIQTSREEILIILKPKIVKHTM